MITEKDKLQFKQKGISPAVIDWQLGVFRKGISYIKLLRAAMVGDGIVRLNEEELMGLAERFEQDTSTSALKFIPASGAASRMFKSLYEYLDDPEALKDNNNEYIDFFIGNIEKFAFYDDLEAALKKEGKHLQEVIKQGDFVTLIKTLLLDNGLGYGTLPKGLLKFHRNQHHTTTPFEEHLFEAACYAAGSSGEVHLHFTVSPEHRTDFEKLAESVLPVYEKRFDLVCRVGFSVQKESTDTLAVDQDNEPFRNDDGSILFRPGGHGALLDNLNDMEEELIFIKNIDNVVPEKYSKATVLYKKALAGKLLEIRDKAFSLLNELDNKELSVSRAAEIFAIIRTAFCYESHEIPDFQRLDSARDYLKGILNRPVRVCGVVKNLGEPGGGPFWATNSMGDVTLQIVESSQVDHDNLHQHRIFTEATHFNPVDIVCYVYNYKGEKFDLKQYVDNSACFISSKSKDGRELKALELPGLWNGAMADWLTVFVEVPVETFNPVKTVNDLLRPMHQ
jgi:hypothetical protein